MRKKALLFYIIFSIVFIISSISVFAEKQDELELPEFVYEADTEPTKQFLLKIGRPQKDESTTKRSYVISGETTLKGITVVLLRYDEEKKCYINFKDTEEEYYWELKTGILLKEVSLPAKGQNKIRILAFKKSDIDKLEAGVNLQISDFTITLQEDIRGIEKSALSDILDELNRRFPSGK